MEGGMPFWWSFKLQAGFCVHSFHIHRFNQPRIKIIYKKKKKSREFKKIKHEFSICWQLHGIYIVLGIICNPRDWPEAYRRSCAYVYKYHKGILYKRCEYHGFCCWRSVLKPILCGSWGMTLHILLYKLRYVFLQLLDWALLLVYVMSLLVCVLFVAMGRDEAWVWLF